MKKRKKFSEFTQNCQKSLPVWAILFLRKRPNPDKLKTVEQLWRHRWQQSQSWRWCFLKLKHIHHALFICIHYSKFFKSPKAQETKHSIINIIVLVLIPIKNKARNSSKISRLKLPVIQSFYLWVNSEKSIYVILLTGSHLPNNRLRGNCKGLC